MFILLALTSLPLRVLTARYSSNDSISRFFIRYPLYTIPNSPGQCKRNKRISLLYAIVCYKFYSNVKSSQTLSNCFQQLNVGRGYNQMWWEIKFE